MQINYTVIVKSFKNLFASHYDDLVLYFYVFGARSLKKIGLEISRMRVRALFEKFKCENSTC